MQESTYFVPNILSHLFALLLHFAVLLFSALFGLTDRLEAFPLFLLCLFLVIFFAFAIAANSACNKNQAKKQTTLVNAIVN